MKYFIVAMLMPVGFLIGLAVGYEVPGPIPPRPGSPSPYVTMGQQWSIRWDDHEARIKAMEARLGWEFAGSEPIDPEKIKAGLQPPLPPPLSLRKQHEAERQDWLNTNHDIQVH